MNVTNLLWLNVNQPDIWPPITSNIQPQPVPSLLFCKSKGSHSSLREASREALCRDSDGRQDGRGASSFTSFMRVQSSDSLWECRRKAQLRLLWFPVRMPSCFCVWLWHSESCSDHTRTHAQNKTSPWTWCIYTHVDMHMQIQIFMCVWSFLLSVI